MDDIESGGEEQNRQQATQRTQQTDNAAQPLLQHPSGIVPTLQNVVATVNLGCKLDLKEIALHARNAEYNPKVPPPF